MLQSPQEGNSDDPRNRIPVSAAGVSSISVKRAARSVVSESRGLARGRSLDRVYAAEVAWEVPFAQAEAFTNWHDVELLKGQRKASIPLPGVGGILARVVRFTAPMKSEVIAGFRYRFSSSLQVTGTARA